MAISDEEALGLKLGAQVSMGKKIFTCQGHQTINGLREPIMVADNGEKLSCVLYVAHILHHYVAPPPKPEESTKEAESQVEGQAEQILNEESTKEETAPGTQAQLGL